MDSELIQALRNPELFPHPATRVGLIETHISWVLLAGEFVYKIKKPLNLGFLDFSTLAKRHHFCQEEIRLNRRTAPELYLDVVAICGTPETPTFADRGEIVEYAVRMRRFDSNAGFDHLLENDQLDSRHIVDLGRRLATLHRIADVAGPDSRQGSFDDVAAPMRDNFTDLFSLLGERSIAAPLKELEGWTADQLQRLKTLLQKRHRDGFVRECHGDAHLGNVALIDGRATLFDCIEFSEDLRWTDVICDLAFTVMDLRDRGATGFAWLLIDEYLAATGDFGGMRALPLYMVYRALVRAKVNALRLDDSGDQSSVVREIEGYLDLALAISREQRPSLVVTMGVSGSGKSWLARRLVERSEMIRIRSDLERKRLHGLDPHADSDSDLDARLYSAGATERTYRYLVEAAGALIDAGIPVLIDAACLKRWQRQLFKDLAARRQVPFAILQCQADDSVLHHRIVDRAATGDDPSEADLDVLKHQQQTLEALDEDEQEHAIVIDTGQADSIDQAVAWLADFSN